jgi:hypothetical protein
MTEEKIIMKAIVVTDQAAGTAGMKLAERPEPQAAINDVVVQVLASGFVPTELAWPSTWTDRLDRDRTPSISGHELAGVVTALGYGTTGLSVGECRDVSRDNVSRYNPRIPRVVGDERKGLQSLVVASSVIYQLDGRAYR